MLPLNLDPTLIFFVGIVLSFLLVSTQSDPPATQIVVVQPPAPETAGGALVGLIIFGLLVLFLAGAMG